MSCRDHYQSWGQLVLQDIAPHPHKDFLVSGAAALFLSVIGVDWNSSEGMIVYENARFSLGLSFSSLQVSDTSVLIWCCQCLDRSFVNFSVIGLAAPFLLGGSPKFGGGRKFPQSLLCGYFMGRHCG